ncbi:UdgX family uracil-DNA binding protein [Acetobacter sp. TBRC 12305]|uniref:Type-4 uracil-DNA glycosylase n=2 Tax=Acetobacter garciniae TaxID=2817435 RepID=A0A939HK48_9PROT|nr:UdgX family uracil-DNA binding protein [Acetobacter garciniae]MBX0345803.1 UdgX family uracil-DNA binding protein [Acetobacter garciniae]
MQCFERAIQAHDPQRFALAYRLVYRVAQGQLDLRDDQDADLLALHSLVAGVDAETRAFRTEFSAFTATQAQRCWLYRPRNYIVEANAAFCVARNARIWEIRTPYRRALWNGKKLFFGPGDSEVERIVTAQWQVSGHGLWHGYPHTVMPPSLEDVHAAGTLAELGDLAMDCRACSLWQPASRTVFGVTRTDFGPDQPDGAAVSDAEGDIGDGQGHLTRQDQCRGDRGPGLEGEVEQPVPPGRPIRQEGPVSGLMLVGEQPGDQEDLAGQPFVGPAGQVLDTALAAAGFTREQVYITNAVKHFRFMFRSGRRLHQKPGEDSIQACRIWLEAERRVLKPTLIVMLGATAASSLLRRSVTISRERSRILALEDGTNGLVTVHPSYLLRLPDEESRQREKARFISDLKLAREFLAQKARAE